jgi:5-methylcytosine-specific restriction endonuclease McrA
MLNYSPERIEQERLWLAQKLARARLAVKRARKTRYRHYAASPLGVITAFMRRRILRRLLKKQGWVCLWCSCPLPKESIDWYDGAQLDHHVPLSRGGRHTVSNLRAVCASCNYKKAAKLPQVFARQISREMAEEFF